MQFLNDTGFLEETDYRSLTESDLNFKNMSDIMNLEKETETRVKRIEQQIQHDKEEHDIKMKILQTELRLLTMKFRKTKSIMKKDNPSNNNAPQKEKIKPTIVHR
ncbi:uncharacterized protein [Halyomorpha halys]|uniref:uncharacterized protein n=1 Tax=Halyomorpha halys TaxID=286706 RepID=UPI0006D5247A|nr:uncharacterized protein LOC106684128 [Halyomorpha halys]